MTKLVQITVSPLNATPKVEVDLDKINEPMRYYLMEYALGVIAQRARNTVKEDGETAATEKARAVVEARARNEMPKAGGGGGGGAKIDSLEKECREAFTQWLAGKKGWTNGKAAKEAVKWREFIVARITDKTKQAALLDDIELRAKRILEAKKKAISSLPDDITLD